MLPYPVRNAAISARKEKERKDKIESARHARMARLSADEYFFLRATENGYDLDKDLSVDHPLLTGRKS
jgi:hypothetical protein